MHSKRMSVFGAARDAVAPCLTLIVATQEGSSLYRYVQPFRICQIWENRLNVMRFPVAEESSIPLRRVASAKFAMPAKFFLDRRR